MALNAPKARKIRKQSIPKIEAEAYINIPANDLIVFSFHYVEQQGMQVTLEDIVSAAFLLFPYTFALKHYPKWPDSALVSRRWSDCKNKGLISGNLEKGFKLSLKGSKAAARVSKALAAVKGPSAKKRKSKPVISVAPIQGTRDEPTTMIARAQTKVPPGKKLVKVFDQVVAALHLTANTEKQRGGQNMQTDTIHVNPAIRRARPIWTEQTTPPAPVPAKQFTEAKQGIRVEKSPPVKIEKIIPSQPKASKEDKVLAGKFVRAMEKSDAYAYFRKNGNKGHISEFDFRSLLLCTMESSPETLARNVKLYKGYATIHNRKDLISLLDYCEASFSNLLKKSTKTKR